MLCEDAIEELYTSCLISKQNEGLIGIRPQLTPLNGLNTEKVVLSHK